MLPRKSINLFTLCDKYISQNRQFHSHCYEMAISFFPFLQRYVRCMDLPSTCVSRFTHVSTSEFFIYNYPWKAKTTGSKQNFTRKNKIHQHAKRCPPNIWLSSIYNTMCCLLCATQSNPNQFHLKPTVSLLHTQEKIVYIHTTEEENLLPISILTVLNDVLHRLKRNRLRNNSSKLNNVGNSVYL